jgi:hypothetical protein
MRWPGQQYISAIHDLNIVPCARTILNKIGPSPQCTLVNQLRNTNWWEESPWELNETTKDTDKTRNQNVVSLRLTACVLNRYTEKPGHETTKPSRNFYSGVSIDSSNGSWLLSCVIVPLCEKESVINKNNWGKTHTGLPAVQLKNTGGSRISTTDLSSLCIMPATVFRVQLEGWNWGLALSSVTICDLKWYKKEKKRLLARWCGSGVGQLLGLLNWDRRVCNC